MGAVFVLVLVDRRQSPGFGLWHEASNRGVGRRERERAAGERKRAPAFALVFSSARSLERTHSPRCFLSFLVQLACLPSVLRRRRAKGGGGDGLARANQYQFQAPLAASAATAAAAASGIPLVVGGGRVELLPVCRLQSPFRARLPACHAFRRFRHGVHVRPRSRRRRRRRLCCNGLLFCTSVHPADLKSQRAL